MSKITTYTGKSFDPVNPDVSKLDINDIAHALSLICRANGHSRYFYSVAQHSIACAKEAAARGYGKEMVAFCLLHDASEAYLSDITRPVKKLLGKYLEAEKKLQDVIYERFVGKVPDETERETVTYIDDLLFSLEFHEYMPVDKNDDYLKLKSGVSTGYENPEEVELQYLGIFKMLADLDENDTIIL